MYKCLDLVNKGLNGTSAGYKQLINLPCDDLELNTLLIQENSHKILQPDENKPHRLSCATLKGLNTKELKQKINTLKYSLTTTGEILVKGLQERHKLIEEYDMRLITIGQLLRLQDREIIKRNERLTVQMGVFIDKSVDR